MQSWKLEHQRITQLFVGWLVTTNLLAIATHTIGWWPFKVLLFICIALLPGMVLLRILHVAFRSVAICLLYGFALGLLVLMLSGLIANTVLYAVGVSRPLEMWGVFGAWNIAAAALIAISAFSNRTMLRIQKLRARSLTKPAWVLLVLSSLLPVCATLGAWRLNNGSDGLVALITLCFAAALIVFVLIFRHRLNEGILVWFVFMLGLAVLLMTSMRGWDIIGHDIERELRVFTLAQQHGRWDIALNRDPYNACLSITILPQMLSVILGVSGVIIFKVMLQLAFAGCVAVVYILLRQYASKFAALIGALLFICYPTFINDAAMLTRQGVAYLFFALAILVISNKAQRWRYKWLFLLCAAGAIISHYSTAYMFVSLFAMAVVIKYVAKWWYKRKHGPERVPRNTTVLSPLFAASLFLMTFIWYSQITATSTGLTTTLQKSIANIPSLFSDEARSSDVAGVLFASGKTQADLYEDYLSGTIKGDIKSVDDAAEFLPGLTEDAMPPTDLGKKLQDMGVNLGLTSELRQHFAKVLQVLAVAGVAYAAYRFIKHKPHAQGLDFTCLSVASIGLLGLMVVLPVLSVNYGILRAFQQTLIFLILPITLLLVKLTAKLPRRFTLGLGGSVIVALFLLFTGVVAQTLGGTSPTITMNNQGLYYGLYYANAADRASFDWMQRNIPRYSDVRAANFNRAQMNDPAYVFNRPGILPTQTTKNSHVYVDHAQVRTQRMYAYFESSPLTMTFPNDYYDVTKNRIFSTTTTGVYK